MATCVDLDPVDRGERGAARWTRHDRPAEPEPRGLAQAALEADDGPQLAEQPDLADRHRPRRDRPVTGRGREGQGERQVQRRLGHRQAAGQVGVDVVAAQADPGTPTEDGDEQAQPVRIEAARLARRVPEPRGADQGLDLDQQRPAALERRRDDAARCRPAVVGEERAGRVGDLQQARLGHLEDADLIGRAEAVLRRPHETQRRVALALDADDGVDQVLEGLRVRRSSRPW